MMPGFALPVGEYGEPAPHKPVRAIYRPAPVAEGGPLLGFGRSGTGGVEGVHFALSRKGYDAYTILKSPPVAAENTYAPYTDLMNEVKVGFSRTMSHLPAIFGVSRQTLYNWINGETPKEHHQAKIVQLAAAARVFIETGFKPTALTLQRTVAQGKTFSELIAQGFDGRESAERLVRIEKRGMTAREKLDALLGDKNSMRLEPSDMGRPASNENA